MNLPLPARATGSASAALLSRRRLLASSAALASAGLLSACGSSNPLEASPTAQASGSGKGVVVGAADFPESEVIAQLYLQALKARGIEASLKPGLGSREVYVKALQDGSIDLIPEYNGSLLAYLEPSSQAKVASEVMSALAAALPKSLAVLSPSEAANSDTLVVTAVTAERHKLASIEDLARVGDQIDFGAPPEMAKRASGLPGLKKVYGFVPRTFKPIADGGGPLTLKALITDAIQVADIFSTSPAIEDNGLVKLSDPKHNWAVQQITPLLRKGALNSAGTAAVNAVQAKLTTEDLVALNRAISGTNKITPAQAAAEWLQEQGLSR